MGDIPTNLPPGTKLDKYFSSLTEEIDLETAGLYRGGLRVKLVNNPVTGEFYIDSGSIYNSYELFMGEQLILEVLTLV